MNDPADSEKAAVIAELRLQALTVDAAALGVAPTSTRPNVWGVLMETGYPEAVATLVALADGTTSLYFSNGGGVIGAGGHASVREASEQLLDVAEAQREHFVPAASTPLPDAGRVRFALRTFAGTLTADGEEVLGEGRHRLSSVFYAAHAVITAIREATPEP